MERGHTDVDNSQGQLPLDAQHHQQNRGDRKQSKNHPQQNDLPSRHQSRPIDQPLVKEHQHSPNKPMKQLTQKEKDYWQHRLPRGFQFYLERLAKGIIRNQPANIPEFAAAYLEELLVNRNAELWKLPRESYFAKLYRKKVNRNPWQPRTAYDTDVRRRPTYNLTQDLPDIVAQEHLPEATRTYTAENFLGQPEQQNNSVSSECLAEETDSQLIKKNPNVLYESNEMVTAIDCYSELKKAVSEEENLSQRDRSTTSRTNTVPNTPTASTSGSTSFETAKDNTSSATRGNSSELLGTSSSKNAEVVKANSVKLENSEHDLKMGKSASTMSAYLKSDTRKHKQGAKKKQELQISKTDFGSSVEPQPCIESDEEAAQTPSNTLANDELEGMKVVVSELSDSGYISQMQATGPSPFQDERHLNATSPISKGKEGRNDEPLNATGSRPVDKSREGSADEPVVVASATRKESTAREHTQEDCFANEFVPMEGCKEIGRAFTADIVDIDKNGIPDLYETGKKTNAENTENVEYEIKSKYVGESEECYQSDGDEAGRRDNETKAQYKNKQDSLQTFEELWESSHLNDSSSKDDSEPWRAKDPEPGELYKHSANQMPESHAGKTEGFAKMASGSDTAETDSTFLTNIIYADLSINPCYSDKLDNNGEFKRSATEDVIHVKPSDSDFQALVNRSKKNKLDDIYINTFETVNSQIHQTKYYQNGNLAQCLSDPAQNKAPPKTEVITLSEGQINRQSELSGMRKGICLAEKVDCQQVKTDSQSDMTLSSSRGQIFEQQEAAPRSKDFKFPPENLVCHKQNTSSVSNGNEKFSAEKISFDADVSKAESREKYQAESDTKNRYTSEAHKDTMSDLWDVFSQPKVWIDHKDSSQTTALVMRCSEAVEKQEAEREVPQEAWDPFGINAPVNRDCNPDPFGASAPVNRDYNPELYGTNAPVNGDYNPDPYGTRAPVNRDYNPDQYGASAPVNRDCYPDQYGTSAPVNRDYNPDLYGTSTPVKREYNPDLFGVNETVDRVYDPEKEIDLGETVVKPSKGVKTEKQKSTFCMSGSEEDSEDVVEMRSEEIDCDMEVIDTVLESEYPNYIESRKLLQPQDKFVVDKTMYNFLCKGMNGEQNLPTEVSDAKAAKKVCFTMTPQQQADISKEGWTYHLGPNCGNMPKTLPEESSLSSSGFSDGTENAIMDSIYGTKEEGNSKHREGNFTKGPPWLFEFRNEISRSADYSDWINHKEMSGDEHDNDTVEHFSDLETEGRSDKGNTHETGFNERIPEFEREAMEPQLVNDLLPRKMDKDGRSELGFWTDQCQREPKLQTVIQGAEETSKFTLDCVKYSHNEIEFSDTNVEAEHNRGHQTEGNFVSPEWSFPTPLGDVVDRWTSDYDQSLGPHDGDSKMTGGYSHEPTHSPKLVNTEEVTKETVKQAEAENKLGNSDEFASTFITHDCTVEDLGNSNSQSDQIHGVTEKTANKCRHMKGKGKREMESALNEAKTYISELEKVSDNIEKILDTQKSETSNIEALEGAEQTHCIPNDSLSSGLEINHTENAVSNDSLMAQTKVAEKFDKKLANKKGAKVSPKLLEKISYQVVDICEGKYKGEGRSKSSQSTILEYSMGNVDVVIRPTKSEHRRAKGKEHGVSTSKNNKKGKGNENNNSKRSDTGTISRKIRKEISLKFNSAKDMTNTGLISNYSQNGNQATGNVNNNGNTLTLDSLLKPKHISPMPTGSVIISEGCVVERRAPTVRKSRIKNKDRSFLLFDGNKVYSVPRSEVFGQEVQPRGTVCNISNNQTAVNDAKVAEAQASGIPRKLFFWSTERNQQAEESSQDKSFQKTNHFRSKSPPKVSNAPKTKNTETGGDGKNTNPHNGKTRTGKEKSAGVPEEEKKAGGDNKGTTQPDTFKNQCSPSSYRNITKQQEIYVKKISPIQSGSKTKTSTVKPRGIKPVPPSKPVGQLPADSQVQRKPCRDRRNVACERKLDAGEKNKISKPVRKMPLPKKTDFPMRVHPFSQRQVSAEYVPELTKRLTIENPQENFMVHTTFVRPNPNQPAVRGKFEVTSRNKRQYLGEKEDFIDTEGTRRLICEPECFAWKDPKTKSLVLENGSFKVTKTKVKSKSNKSEGNSNLRQTLNIGVKEKPGLSENVNGVNESKFHRWYDNGFVRMVDNFIMIGKGWRFSNINKMIMDADKTPFQPGGTQHCLTMSNEKNADGTRMLCKEINNNTNSSNIDSNNNNINGSNINSEKNKEIQTVGPSDYYLHLIDERVEDAVTASKDLQATEKFEKEQFSSLDVSSFAETSRGRDLVSHQHCSLENAGDAISVRATNSQNGLLTQNTYDLNLHQSFTWNFHLYPQQPEFSDQIPSLDGNDENHLYLYSYLDQYGTPDDLDMYDFNGSNPQEKEWFLKYNTNNNSNCEQDKSSDMDDTTLQDIDQIPTEPTHGFTDQAGKKTRTTRRAKSQDVHCKRNCVDCSPPRSGGDTGIKETFESQVEATDITTTGLAQTGSSLALRGPELPKREKKRHLLGHKARQWVDCNRPTPFSAPEQSQNLATQVNNEDICPSVETQTGDDRGKRDNNKGRGRQYKGHVNKYDICDCQVPTEHRIDESTDFEAQVNVLDITACSNAQTGSSLALNPSFQSKPPSQGGQKVRTGKANNFDDDACSMFLYEPPEKGVPCEIETQVGATDINPSNDAQTGESLWLTSPFPPPKTEYLDEESVSETMWGDITMYDMTPDHRSVFSYTKQYEPSGPLGPGEHELIPRPRSPANMTPSPNPEANVEGTPSRTKYGHPIVHSKDTDPLPFTQQHFNNLMTEAKEKCQRDDCPMKDVTESSLALSRNDWIKFHGEDFDRVGENKIKQDAEPVAIEEDDLSFEGNEALRAGKFQYGSKVIDQDESYSTPQTYSEVPSNRDHEKGEYRVVPKRRESFTITSHDQLYENYPADAQGAGRKPAKRARRKNRVHADATVEEDDGDDENDGDDDEEGEDDITQDDGGHKPYKRKRRPNDGPSVETQTHKSSFGY